MFQSPNDRIALRGVKLQEPTRTVNRPYTKPFGFSFKSG
jgi:hypothetical protein